MKAIEEMILTSSIPIILRIGKMQVTAEYIRMKKVSKVSEAV
jgi:hypothetical protein